MGARSDRKLARIKRNLEEELYNPFTPPERAEQILYALRDSDARRTGVLASQIQNIHHIKRGEPSHGYILGGSQSFPRNIIVEKADLRIKKASSKLPSYSSEYLPATISKPVSFFPFNKYDFVGKRSRFIRTAVGQTTDIVPWSPSLDAEMSAKYGKVGPEQPKRFNERGNKNFEYDMMDEFDQKIHDLTERYGGDASKADAAMRSMLKKELPPFFKNSKLSTKDLHAVSKGFSKIYKTPFVGGFAKLAINNPSVAALSAAIAVSRAEMSSSRTRLQWQMLQSFGGRTSPGYEAASFATDEDRAQAMKSSIGSKLFVAGLKYGYGFDKLTQATMYGFDISGINPNMSNDEYLAYIYKNASKLNENDRLLALNTLGISESDYEKGRLLSGGEMSYENEVQYTNQSWKTKRDENLKRAWYDPRYWDALTTPDWWIDLWSPLGSDGKGGTKLNTAVAAAKSDASYDATRAANPSPSGTLTPSVAGSTNNWYGTTIITDADKMDGIAADAEKTANARTEQRLNAAITADPKGQ